MERTLAAAAQLVHGFSELVVDVPYQAKGILFSEALFIRAAVGDLKPDRILESGRARGQSTHLFSVCFPKSMVVSVERDSDSPDVPVAAERLKDRSNLDLRFGDSRAILPDLVCAGDVVFIDGPKGHRSLDLAFALLETGKPPLVFVHDCFQGSTERGFLERETAAFYSDHPEFVDLTRSLDEPVWQAMDADGSAGWRPYRFEGADQASYGATVACIPLDPSSDYRRLRKRLSRHAFFSRLRRSLSKRLRP